MVNLKSSSWLEIKFSVHQCEWFPHSYKTSHGGALLCIFYYLKENCEYGSILKPNNNMQVYWFLDLDFVGIYEYEDPDDPIYVESRTGYVIKFSICPIVWVSKIQT